MDLILKYPGFLLTKALIETVSCELKLGLMLTYTTIRNQGYSKSMFWDFKIPNLPIIERNHNQADH